MVARSSNHNLTVAIFRKRRCVEIIAPAGSGQKVSFKIARSELTGIAYMKAIRIIFWQDRLDHGGPTSKA